MSHPTILYTVQILCIGTDRSQQTVQTMIRLLLKKQSDQGLRCLPFLQHPLGCINAMLHQTFLFLGQLWQLFEVSQILEFLRYVALNVYSYIRGATYLASQVGYSTMVINLGCKCKPVDDINVHSVILQT